LPIIESLEKAAKKKAPKPKKSQSQKKLVGA